MLRLDPRGVLGPRELSAAEIIAESQILGEECDALIEEAIRRDPTTLDIRVIQLAVGLLHTNYAGWGVGNWNLWRSDPANNAKPTHESTELRDSGNRLVIASSLVPGHNLGSGR